MNDYTNIKSTLPKNEIPYTLDENWKWYKWGDIIQDYQQGLIRSNSELNDDYSIEYFKMNFINENGDYSFKGLPKTEASWDEILRYKIREGDFFINVRNSRELVGKTCAIYNVLRDIVFNHMLVRIKHKNYITGTFMSAYFNTKFGKQILETCKKGTTTVIALYQKDLYNLPVPIPNEKLLKKIDKIYNDINKKIQLLHQINDNLAELAKIIYDYWFVQFDFPDENGKPYKTSGGKMVYNEVLKREIPEGWKVKKIGEIIEPLESGKRPKGGIDKTLKEGSPSLGAECIDELGIFNFSSTRYIPYSFQNKIISGVIKNNDILIYKDGAYVGKTTIFKDNFPFDYATINEHIFLIRAKNVLFQNFLLFTLKQKNYFDIMQSLGQKAAQPGLNQEDLKSIKILVPNQKNITQFYIYSEKLLMSIFKNANQFKELESLRDWLLPMLMNGQVSVE